MARKKLAKRTTKWQKALTLKEVAHLRAMLDGVSLVRVSRLFELQAEKRQEGLDAGYSIGIAEPCWECRAIERKLKEAGVIV